MCVDENRYQNHICEEDLVLFGNLHFDLVRRRLCYLDDSCGTQFCRSGRQYKCYLSFHLQIQMQIQIQIQYLEDCCGTQFCITNAFISSFYIFHSFFSTCLKPKNVFPIIYMRKKISILLWQICFAIQAQTNIKVKCFWWSPSLFYHL